MKSSFLPFLALGLLALAVGCTQSSSADHGSLPAGAKTVSFDVPKMDCEGCMLHVQETLAQTDGVIECKVDLKAKTATCTVDPAKFKTDVALKKLAEEEYPSTVKDAVN